MTNVALISVILRLIAIWLFVSALDFLAYGAGLMTQQPRFIVLVVSKLALAALFFFAPVWCARKMVHAKAEQGDHAPWTPDILQAVLFSAAGIWIVVITIASQELAGGILFLLTGDTMGFYATGASFLIALLQLAIGIWLLFGARGLFHLVSAARRARLDNKLFEDEKP